MRPDTSKCPQVASLTGVNQQNVSVWGFAWCLGRGEKKAGERRGEAGSISPCTQTAALQPGALALSHTQLRPHLTVPMPGGQGLSPFLSTSPSFRFPSPPSTTSRSQEALTPPAWHPASNHPVAHSPWLGTSHMKTGQWILLINV